MKDSQPTFLLGLCCYKYIKANNERFSTGAKGTRLNGLSISRRIMKDSQRRMQRDFLANKYIKANNERFSTIEGAMKLFI